MCLAKTDWYDTKDNTVLYWEIGKDTVELDFVLQYGQNVVPIEVESRWEFENKELESLCRANSLQSKRHYAFNGGLSWLGLDGKYPLYVINSI